MGVEGRGQERNIKERVLAFGGGDPGGMERWPRKLMTSLQISWLPRAQGRLWRPGPFQLSHSPLILVHRSTAGLPGSAILWPLYTAKGPGKAAMGEETRAEQGTTHLPRGNSKLQWATGGGGGTGEGVKFFHFHSQLSGG